MSAKKKSLGRGLDALLGDKTPVAVPINRPEQPHPEVSSAHDKAVAIDLIDRSPYQPRREFDADKLAELAQSIEAQGIIQPVVVRAVKGGRFELIAGERRWRAAQLAGMDEVPVVIHEADDATAMAMALVENIQRENLSPLEEATALQRLLEEFGMTHQVVAETVGRSRAAVSNLIRLLDLKDDVKALLNAGKIEMGHGRALLALRGSAQSQAAEQVARKGLSVRQTEALIRRLQQPAETKAAPELDPDVRRLQDDLGDKLGASVRIQQGDKGKGRIVIDYHSLDELDGILGHIH